MVAQLQPPSKDHGMLMNRFISEKLSSLSNRRRLRAIYQKCQQFTMIPEQMFLSNLRLAEKVRDVPGCVVECGVWRGGMSAGLCHLLGPERCYYLFDSFQGLPDAKEIDGNSAIEWQQDKTGPDYFDNCSAPSAFAEKAMKGASARSFHLIEGWFDHTLPMQAPKEQIALLRLDADWYEGTMKCLESLFDLVSTNGLIIVDDYYTWDGCTRAVHDFLSRRSSTERIRSFEDVCYISKRA
jgi:O-methyltransferase